MRKKLGIQDYTQPAQDILNLAGSFKPKIKKPLLKARKEMETKYK